ncbi:MAG: hypothetical protein PHG06_15195 [Parabacteroides sp.]|nr:hypothetical protein [Parabacteroides sp.]
MKTNKLIFIFIFCFLYLTSLPIFVLADGECEILRKLDHQKIISVPWDVGLNEPLKVVVNESFDKKEKIHIREFAIYRHVNNHLKKIYSFETPDHPVSISQTQDSGGKLLTIWIGGSAYHISVYYFNSNNVIRVLETGSRMFPELIHLSSGADAFIITGSNGNKLNESEIYCWQNNNYVMLKKLPFERRFEKVCK